MPRSTAQKPTDDANPDVPDSAPAAISSDGTDLPASPAEPAKPKDAESPRVEQPASPDEAAPEPDQYGRYRVHDADTGHKFTINAPGLPHGNFTVLDEPASDELTGQPLPPEFAEAPPESAVETTPDGL